MFYTQIYQKLKEKKPLLGVCYGAQYLAHFSNGLVAPSNTREYGRANLSFIKKEEVLFNNISEGSQVWMSHSDTIKETTQQRYIISKYKRCEKCFL